MIFFYFENGLKPVPIETNTCYWNKFQTSNFYRSYGTSFQNLHFSYKPFASPKQKHLLNSNVWNKFQILKIYHSYGTLFLNLHFFYKPFASKKQFSKINFNFLKKQPQQYSNSPTLTFSNSSTLKLSHSPTLQLSNSPILPLKINALPANFYLRRLPPIKELLFCRRFPYFL